MKPIDQDPFIWSSSCGDPEGGGVGGVRNPPLENHKNIGFLSNTKLPSQHSIMLGHQRHASETSFKWRIAGGSADDGPLIVVFGSFLPHQTEKKNGIKVGTPQTKLSRSVHDHHHQESKCHQID